ncbi:MAG: hypothetical protein R3Y19_01635 [Rikenellaceae bacterium]
MKRLLFSLLVIFTTLAAIAQPMDRGIKKSVFMPKGQWFAGGSASYLEVTGDDYDFLMINNIEAKAFTLSTKLMVGYTLSNNVAAGVSFSYDRTMVQIDNIDLSLSEDMVFGVSDYYSIQHIYTGTAFLRTYISLGDSKRFGLFNDVRFNFGAGQGKIFSGTGDEMVGTYEKITQMGMTLSPGISVFATNFMSVEASIGILGLSYSRTEQVTNQVYEGSFESLSANFKINLLSIALGITLYF